MFRDVMGVTCLTLVMGLLGSALASPANAASDMTVAPAVSGGGMTVTDAAIKAGRLSILGTTG